MTATPRRAAIKELLPELLGPTIAISSPVLKVSYRLRKVMRGRRGRSASREKYVNRTESRIIIKGLGDRHVINDNLLLLSALPREVTVDLQERKR